MKKIITGLVLITVNLSNAHVHSNQAQAVEVLNARIALLQATLHTKLEEEKKLAAAILAKQNRHQETQVNSLEKGLNVIRNEINKLKNDLQVSKNSVKSLQSK